VSYFAAQVLNGLCLGSIYSLIALGFALVYSILRFLNFAHSEVFTSGAFAGYFTLLALGPHFGPWTRFAVATVVAALAAGSLAVLIERVAYRPLRHMPPVTVLLTAIGVSITLQNIGRIAFSPQTRGYPTLDLPLAPRQVGLAVLAGSFVLLWWLIYRLPAGIRIRAVAENLETARLMGIEPGRVIVLVFFLGGTFAGVAGVVWGLVYGTVQPEMGFLPGLKAFIIAVVGSVGDLRGTLVVGMALGIIEALAAGFLPSSLSALREVIVLSLLLLALMARPNGLFGSSTPVKV